MSDVDSHLGWLPSYSLTTSLDDRDTLKLAYQYANDSPDPRTKNGAVLINSEKHLIGCAANRFPIRIQETPERLHNRQIKLQMIVHAEQGAILHAARMGKVTYGSTLFCPFYACSECAKTIIEARIIRVVGHAQLMAIARDHNVWRQSIVTGFEMMIEAGVELCLYDGHLGVLARFNGENITV